MGLFAILPTLVADDKTLQLKFDQREEVKVEVERLTLPAEWFPQSGIQLTWPHEATDWAPILKEVTETYIRMAYEIASRELLLIVTPDVESVKYLIEMRLPKNILKNIRYFECDTNDTWARDHAFITLVSEQGKHLLDFKFNGWGEKFPSTKDNAINRHLFGSGLVNGEYVDHTDFVLEGGSIESDGKGTIFTTSCCMTAKHRNEPMDRNGIEEAMKKSLQADRILWIDHGHLIGDDTDGHIDTLVRIAPNNILLYVGCDDATDPQYDDMKAMEEQLKGFKTAGGEPYRLMKLPMPSPIYDGEDRLPATYANFLIMNKAIIMPTYAQHDNDESARKILQKAFKGYDVICIDSRTLILQHGSIHCCTMQYPSGVIKSTDKMKIGILQLHNTSSINDNIKGIAENITDLAKRGAELIVLQELHNSIYFCQTEDVGNFDLAETIPGPSTGFYGELARQNNVVVVTSLFEKRAAGLYHNTAVVIEKDGSIAGIYRKRHIPDDPAYYEKFYFTPGDLGFHPIKTSIGNLGILVCWDQWYPEAARLMALQGAELLIYPTAIGWESSDSDQEKARQLGAWQTVQRGHAVANGLPVIAVNRCGWEPDPSGQTNGITFWGTSFVTGPQGDIVYEASADEEESIVVEMDMDHSEEVRRWWPFLRDRRIDAYGDITRRFID